MAGETPMRDNEDPRRYASSGGNLSGLVPIPDPTLLTTQLVDRALAAFREVMDTRLAALDKAVEVADANAIREADAGLARYKSARREIAQEQGALRQILERDIQ